MSSPGISPLGRFGRIAVLLGALAGLPGACHNPPQPADTDVIVIGGGIAGLSAALEASASGADVMIIEIASVAGGHAVKAGGFALVGTPVQARKGYADSPDLAYDDLMSWGEDADPDWVRLFVDHARSEIYDWLTGFGVKFTILLDTPEDSVPRFHFAGGAAVRVVVPMLREAMQRENLQFVMNAEARNLARAETGLFKVRTRSTRSTRTDIAREYLAPVVIIAAGGFQSNLDMVRDNFRVGDSPHAGAPRHLLIGSGRYATGTGLRLGQGVGAKLVRMDRQVTFVNGLPDPRHPQHGLHVENPAGIRVAANGRRFVNESASAKVLEAAVMNLDQRMHWLIFDARGLKKLRIRGAVWLNRATIAREILDNPEVVRKAGSIQALATATGLPGVALQETIDRYNDFVTNGEDADFGRFGPTSQHAPTVPPAIGVSPFYAFRLLPMTRKSMGGLAIDTNAQVIGHDNRPIEGLFAAGEVTGVAGINGSHGGFGTFLAPSVLTGRIAGRHAAARARLANTVRRADSRKPASSPGEPEDAFSMMGADQVRRLLERRRTGYWHWERSHAIVLERGLSCTDCHSRDWPTVPAVTQKQSMRQLETCVRCH